MGRRDVKRGHLNCLRDRWSQPWSGRIELACRRATEHPGQHRDRRRSICSAGIAANSAADGRDREPVQQAGRAPRTGNHPCSSTPRRFTDSALGTCRRDWWKLPTQPIPPSGGMDPTRATIRITARSRPPAAAHSSSAGRTRRPTPRRSRWRPATPPLRSARPGPRARAGSPRRTALQRPEVVTHRGHVGPGAVRDLGRRVAPSWPRCASSSRAAAGKGVASALAGLAALYVFVLSPCAELKQPLDFLVKR